jgi:hypothetical protein
MEKAGLFDRGTLLDVNALKAVVEADPALIDDWSVWSADKRYSGPCLEAHSALGCARFIVAELAMFREYRWREEDIR